MSHPEKPDMPSNRLAPTSLVSKQPDRQQVSWLMIGRWRLEPGWGGGGVGGRWGVLMT